MSNNVKSASGDMYARWEDVKCDRQSYANSIVAAYQRQPGIKKFAEILRVFRSAGEEYDRWTEERSREIAA